MEQGTKDGCRILACRIISSISKAAYLSKLSNAKLLNVIDRILQGECGLYSDADLVLQEVINRLKKNIDDESAFHKIMKQIKEENCATYDKD